jgi:tetratricopeptide (TPR) repeat protein
LKDYIKNGTPEEQEVSKKDLIQLYDEWVQNFPKKRNKSVVGDIISKKAQALLDYKQADLKVIYNTFDQAYKQDATSFSNPKFLYNYFKTLYDRYKTGDIEVSMELLFNKYEEVSEKFELESTKLAKKLDIILKKEESGTALTSRESRSKRIYNVNSNAIGTFLSNLDAIIAKEATCENLIPLYQRNFEANKTDALWIKRAASRMDSKECSDDPLFVTLVEALHALEPSADSAYYLGLLNDKSGNADEALKYYEESIALETDNYKKAKILLKIANKFKAAGRKSSARSYANKALGFQPSLGRAYLLIANMYADSANQCGDSQFNKRAVYWLAADVAKKAGQVDASLKRITSRTVESYIGRAPSKTDIFTEGNAGVVIKFDCWINRSLTVPSL